MNVAAKPKAFAWSYSKLKNFETCPRRHAAVDLKKEIQETKSQALIDGDELHEAMYQRVVGSTPLPPKFIYMEKWAEKLVKVQSPLQVIQGELKLAVNKDGQSVGFFERGVWLRGRIDYFRLLPSGDHDLGLVVDYKTGTPREDDTQLMLNAYLIFQHYKAVTKIRSMFLWTEYSDTSHYDYVRQDMPALMNYLFPRINAMQTAYTTDTFEPKPCGLCYEYCPVTSCEYHGKRHRRVMRS